MQTSFPELRSQDLAARMPGRNRLEVVDGIEGLSENVPAGYDFRSGSVTVTQGRLDVAERASRALLERATLSTPEVLGLQLLLHEEIHGHSPIRPFAYQGVGAVLEEIGTELLAREAAARAGIMTQAARTTLGHYPELVEGVLAAVAAHVPAAAGRAAEEVFDLLVEAILRVRSGPGRIRNPDAYFRRLAVELDVPDEGRPAFRAALDALDRFLWE